MVNVAVRTDGSNPRLVLNPVKWWNWWLTPIAPATLGLVYLCANQGWSSVLAKSSLERLALYLLAIACGAFFNHAVTRRDPLHVILGCLAVVFLCREIHFTGTSTGIYVALVVLVIWTVLWRDRLVSPLERGQMKSWLVATATMYLLSQLIARRVFAERHLGILPQEELLNVALEEMFETVAHICLIVTSFAGSFRPICRGEPSVEPVVKVHAQQLGVGKSSLGQH